MIIAFVFALAMNLFAYWNSDRMVLSMYGARQVDEAGAPQLYATGARPRPARRPADAQGLYRSRTTSPMPLPPGAIPQHAAVAVNTGLCGC